MSTVREQRISVVKITARGRELALTTVRGKYPNTESVIKKDDSTLKEVADAAEAEYKSQNPGSVLRDALPLIVKLTRELQTR